MTRLRALVLVPVLLALGACSGSVSVGSDFDADAVAKQVQKAQQDATPDHVSDATCPDVDDVEKGTEIDCSVEIEGVEAPYTVTITSIDDGRANFDIAPAQAIVSVTKTVDAIQERVEAQGLTNVSVDCGSAAVIVQDPQTSFTCTLTHGDRTQEVTVEIEDLDGHVRLST